MSYNTKLDDDTSSQATGTTEEMAFGTDQAQFDQLEMQEDAIEAQELAEIEAPLGRKKGCCSYCKHMVDTYNYFFLFSLGLQYFNNGAKAMNSLSYQFIFKDIYGLPPGVSQQYSAIMNLPWTIKIVYGFFTDMFPICGSRKRNYIILMGFI